MADIASRFLLANLAAATAVLLVLFIRKPARRLFGARLAYGLWLLVPLAGFASLLPRVVEIVVTQPPIDSAAPLQPPPVVEAAPPAPIIAEDSMPPAAPLSVDPWVLGWLAWLAGAAAMTAWLAYGQSRFLSDARKGKAGPAVVGVLRPRIIVPADFENRFEPKERDVILAHETIHLARHDAHINALVALMRCVCWFNPMIHIAAHLARIDQELACDATVAERHPKAKAVYASALLKAQLAMRPLPLGCYWPAGTEHPLTERVEMLKRPAPGGMRRTIGASALVVLALGTGLSAWAVKPAEEHHVLALGAAPLVLASGGIRLPQPAAGEAQQVGPVISAATAVQGEPELEQKAPDAASELSAAIEDGDIRRIIEAGGTARDVAAAMLAADPPRPGDGPNPARYEDPATARFVREPDGRIFLTWKGPGGAIWSKLLPKTARIPAGLISAQPILFEQQQPGSPSALSAAIASGDVRQIIANGGTAADVATALREKNGPQVGSTVDLREPDPATAKFVRTREGAIALAWRTQEGGAVMGVREDIQTYAPPGGIASLPLFAEAFPLPVPQPVPLGLQQNPSTPRIGSQELPPPPFMRQFPLPAPENFAVAGPPPEFAINSPIYLRGKVERIEFGDTKYVIFLRASAIGRYFEGADSHLSGIGAAHANSDLWELSPTNYFGDRDAIRADLIGKNVEVSGVKLTKNCMPACRIKVKDLIMPRSSQVPQPPADASLITQFGLWYDTTSQVRVRGVVERIEFSERTFDAYIRSEGRGALPGRLYQARSEYRSSQADIERELLNKAVTATGWRAREGINTFCDPVCGIYAINFTLENQSQLTPAAAALVTPSSLATRPRGGIFTSIADLNAPIVLTGRITRYVPTVLGPDNPQLWIEASSVQPETTFGSKSGTVWVVAGFPFNVQDDWVGRTVIIRGFNVEDKRCQPQCLMAGDSIQIIQ